MASLQELRYKAYLALKNQGKLTEEPKQESIKTDSPRMVKSYMPEEKMMSKEANLNLNAPSGPKKGSLYKEEEGKIVLTTDEKVYQGSFGIDPVLIRMQQILSNTNCKINTVLVNIATCVRNAQDKTLSMKENIQRIGMEIQTVSETLIELFNNSVIGAPYLVFYMNSYHHQYPKEKIRPITEGKAEYFSLLDYFYKTLNNKQKYSNGKTTVNFIKLDRGIDYGVQLQSVLKNVSEEVRGASYTGNYCLISHQPLDFHVLNKCPSGLLISSHTGEMLTNKMLGYKVFKEEHVPFSMLLHGLLGDKEQIKPSVSIKARLAIKEKAFVDKWYLKTDSYIKQQLRTIGIIVT